MILASVHLAPVVTVPLAIALGAWLIWHWWALGRQSVPPSRRMIRRIAAGLMLITLPMLVRATSFVDPDVEKRAYLLAWSAVMVMIVLVSITALIDAVNNLLLHQRLRQEHLEQAARSLASDVSLARRQSSAAAMNGEPSPTSSADRCGGVES